MTINARALGVIAANDNQITQTVRLFQGVTPIRDITPSYPPGPDQATSAANLASVVKSILQRAAADSTLVPCAPGTILDLSDPVVTPPPTPPAGFDAWLTAANAYRRLNNMSEIAPSVTAQRIADAKAAADALYQSAFEAFL